MSGDVRRQSHHFHVNPRQRGEMAVFQRVAKGVVFLLKNHAAFRAAAHFNGHDEELP